MFDKSGSHNFVVRLYETDFSGQDLVNSCQDLVYSSQDLGNSCQDLVYSCQYLAFSCQDLVFLIRILAVHGTACSHGK